MSTMIREAATLAAPTRTGPGRVLLTIITPGVGSSGEYTPEVLEQAAQDRVFPKGTLGMIDHPTVAEGMERPEGSLHHLALALTEDARWDGSALVAEARVRSTYRDLVDDLGEYIGVSISAAAELRDGVVERLIPDPFNRVDLVSVPGRGGRIAAVLESARARETTVSDISDAARAAVAAAYKDSDEYAWIADRDDTYLYLEVEGRPGGTRLVRRPYTVTGASVTITGDEQPVTRRTEYDPQTIPATPAGATETATTQEGHMAKIEIDEQEYTTLRESAGRAETLAEENEALREAAEKAAQVQRERAKESARKIVADHYGDTAPAFLVAAAEAAAQAEDFDPDAFREQVAEAAPATDTAQPNVTHDTAHESAGRRLTDAEIAARING